MSSVRTDGLRTFLSLTGVTVGVFSILTVFTTAGTLQQEILEGMDAFGTDVLNVHTFPMTARKEEPTWWEYARRRPVSVEDFSFVADRISLPGTLVYCISDVAQVTRQNLPSFRPSLLMTTSGLREILRYEILQGRDFTERESRQTGRPSALLGYDVARRLSLESRLRDSTVRVDGIPVRVIGVLKRQGERVASLFDLDRSILLPLDFSVRFYEDVVPHGLMLAKHGKEVDREAYVMELRRLLRTVRRLKPGEPDDFCINEMSLVLSVVEHLFRIIRNVGWCIGFFSLLIGGFGIANILYVSVRERTGQIGLQKALGARRSWILLGFLAESSFFSLAGGLLGILAVFVLCILSRLVSEEMMLTFRLSDGLLAAGCALVTGVAAGLAPALYAARLHPMEACRA